MQFLLTIVDTISKMDVEEELVTFLCSVLAFLVLVYFRNSKVDKKTGKLFKHINVHASNEANTDNSAGVYDEKFYVKIDKSFRTAFEKEDYWQVLRCWKQLKHFNQASIHLSMIIRAMRFCNKGAYFIVTELKDFFKAHPQECSIGFINDLLEPLARRSEDAQLVDLLVKMIPALNLTKDSRTYEIVLTMYASTGNITKTQEMMSEMKAKDVTFTPRATVAIMTMGLKTGNADVVLKAFLKLKPAWDDRDTWAVSMFALERHKNSILMEVVKVACQKGKATEISDAISDMKVPEEVSKALKWQAALQKAQDLSSAASEGSGSDSDEVLERTGSNSFCIKKSQKFDRADSSASTSEGSRSDSEEEVGFAQCIRPPPGLIPPPPGF